MTYTVRIDRSKEGSSVGSGILRTVFVVTMTLLLVRSTYLPGTNSYFADRADAGSHTLSLGVWIPRLDTTASDASPNADKAHAKSPCVEFSYSGLTSGTATIWYEFSDDGDPKSGGTKYDGTCVPIPAGDPTRLQAVAINDANGSWRSAVVKKSFMVIAAAKPGDVVINEVMWPGSADDGDDEWIELRNMTDRTVDLSGWSVGLGGKDSVDIPSGYSIRQKGYFLILAKKRGVTEVNLPKNFGTDDGIDDVIGLKLQNGGERVTLSDATGNTIDATPGDRDGWAAGTYDSGKFAKSMERDDDPKEGSHADRWHTCTDVRCNDAKYWRGGGQNGKNFGTPGRKNLSSDGTDTSDPDASSAEPVMSVSTATVTQGTAPVTTCADASATCVESPSTPTVPDPTTVPETKAPTEPANTDATTSGDAGSTPNGTAATAGKEAPSADKEADTITKGNTGDATGTKQSAASSSLASSL